MDTNGNQIRGTSVNSLRDGLPNCDEDPGTFMIDIKQNINKSLIYSNTQTHRNANSSSIVERSGITKCV